MNELPPPIPPPAFPPATPFPPPKKPSKGQRLIKALGPVGVALVFIGKMLAKIKFLLFPLIKFGLPILKTGQIKLSVAEDDEGHSMIPKNENPNNNMSNRVYYGWGWRGYMQQVQAPLAWSSKSSRTVKMLKGLIPVTLLADQKPSIVTDKLLASKGKKYKVGDATFHVEEITEMPGKQYQIRLNVTENSKEAQNDYSRLQSMQQRLELQDDKGNKVPSYVNITSWGNGPMSAQFQIMVQPSNNAKLGAPAKLVYSSWVLMEHEVAFEFKDLPLP